MIIVSNTSPLTNLAAIGQFELLRILYQEIEIAQSVWDELNAKNKQWPYRHSGFPGKRPGRRQSERLKTLRSCTIHKILFEG